MRMFPSRSLRALALASSAAMLVGCQTKLPMPTLLEAHDEFIVGHDTIGGTVKSARGEEAGVWVIAETVDLPTRFAKIVVTDQRGRFLIPDLPKASYEVWVHGYGLVDSPKVDAAPGTRLELKAAVASNAAADRTAAGESPVAKPARPQGSARDLVLTLWDWSRPTAHLNGLTGTDERRPTVNPHGPLYGALENGTDFVPVLEPARNRAHEMLHPVRARNTTGQGDRPSRDGRGGDQAAVMDERERVWFATHIRAPQNPGFCGKGSTHASARAFPLPASTRQLSMYDPKSGRFTLIDTCFTTQRLAFAEDASHTLWIGGGDGGQPVLGWLDRKRYDDTGDAAAAQGWTPFVLDSNGNGRRDGWTEPGQPLAADKDQRIAIGLRGVAVDPVDGSVWGTAAGRPGYVVRVAPGRDPATTALTEIYQPPAPGYGPSDGDIDSNGVFWVALASGHLASFDRRRCKGALNGPAAATGRHCPEGWTLYALPGPQVRDVSDAGSAEVGHAVWVDRFDVLGLGRDVPVATGNLNASLLALVGGKFVDLAVPYPSGFFATGMEGRIDDPASGWRGRGLWANYTARTGLRLEDGKENRPRLVRFQLRPDPLAR
jgi:hypothetical protein